MKKCLKIIALCVPFLALGVHSLYWSTAVDNWIKDPFNGSDEQVADYVSSRWCRPWFGQISSPTQDALVVSSIKRFTNLDGRHVFSIIEWQWKENGSFPTLPNRVEEAAKQGMAGEALTEFISFVKADFSFYVSIPAVLDSANDNNTLAVTVIEAFREDPKKYAGNFGRLLSRGTVSPAVKRVVLNKLKEHGMIDLVLNNDALMSQLRAEMGSDLDKVHAEH